MLRQISRTLSRVARGGSSISIDSSGNVSGVSLPNNLLINGDFRVAQRGTSFTSTTTPANSDDTYLLDRWVLLSDGNDIVDVSQETSVVPTGAYAACKLDVETANAKFGLLQIVEARNAKAIIGGTCSLSFRARVTGTTIADVHAAVISWSSTADTVTSDVVSAWNGDGTDPTLVANWTYENVPSTLALTTSYQTFEIENISIDTASTTNVAVFIWTDDVTMDVGDFLYIADVNLVPGAVATAINRRPYRDELALCQYYAEWMALGALGPAGSGVCGSATLARVYVPFSERKRTLPTFSMTTATDFEVVTAAFGNIVLSDLTDHTKSPVGAVLLCTVAAGLTSGHAAYLRAVVGGLGILKFESEL